MDTKKLSCLPREMRKRTPAQNGSRNSDAPPFFLAFHIGCAALARLTTGACHLDKFCRIAQPVSFSKR
jgi:hypothetical protein